MKHERLKQDAYQYLKQLVLSIEIMQDDRICVYLQGSLFVTFVNQEDMEKFLSAESVEFDGAPLEKRMTKYI